MCPLRNYRAHSIILYSPACEARSARVVVADLIKRYGEESDRDDVLAPCRCSRCGRRGIPDVRVS